MGAQDRTEKILRSLHVMLSKSEVYPSQPTKVIVDKEVMLELLKELNKCMYAMMEEYEMTLRSRDKAERDFRKRGDEIIWDASRKAEDIYAASVMYTDEALNGTQTIMRDTRASLKKIYQDMEEKLKEQERLIRSNQSELKSQLQDLVDTEKYLKLIEERNKQIQKEKEEKEGKPVRKEPSIYANRMTEIKINKEYFESHGISLEDEAEEISSDKKLKEEDSTKVSKNQKSLENKDASEAVENPESKEITEKIPETKLPEIKVDLDADYFRWKEEQEKENQKEEEKEEKPEEGHKFWKGFAGKKAEKE